MGVEFDAENSRAFWTTMAQVVGVFAIPLVLEARRSVARWRKTSKKLRRIQTIYYYVAAFVIIQTLSTALSRLTSPRADPIGEVMAVFGIQVLAVGLVFMPVTSYLIVANSDWFEVMTRFMPWSRWRRRRREFRSGRAEFNGLFGESLTSLEELEEQLIQIKDWEKQLKALQGIVDGWRAAGVDIDKMWDEVDFGDASPDRVAEVRRTLIEKGAVPLYSKALSSTRKAILRHKDLLVKGLDVAEKYESASLEFEKITYLSPEVRAWLDSRATEAADDAGEQVLAPPSSAEFRDDAEAAELLEGVAKVDADRVKLDPT